MWPVLIKRFLHLFLSDKSTLFRMRNAATILGGNFSLLARWCKITSQRHKSWVLQRQFRLLFKAKRRIINNKNSALISCKRYPRKKESRRQVKSADNRQVYFIHLRSRKSSSRVTRSLREDFRVPSSVKKSAREKRTLQSVTSRRLYGQSKESGSRHKNGQWV